jgi:hypothetical protein
MLGKVAEWIVAGALFDKFVAFAVEVALDRRFAELASIL